MWETYSGISANTKTFIKNTCVRVCIGFIWYRKRTVTLVTMVMNLWVSYTKDMFTSSVSSKFFEGSAT